MRASPLTFVLKTIMSEFRVCRRCSKTRRLEHFYRYRKGEPGRRLICRDCSREQRDLWLVAKATPEQRERYYQRMRECSTRRAERVKTERATDLRDRVAMTRGMVQTMRGWGLTYKQIAEGSGVARRTVSMYDKGEPVQYSHRNVVDKIGRFYQRELGRRNDGRTP